MKLPSVPRTKYSFASWQPPTIATAPSATKSLLCRRWFSRRKSATRANARAMVDSRPDTNELNTLLDVWLRRQPEQQAVHAGGVQIVEQQAHAHAHAALRGVAHVVQDQGVDAVVGNRVVLTIKRVTRVGVQGQPRVERKSGLRQRLHARLAGRDAGVARQRGQRCIERRGARRRSRPLDRRQAHRAAGQQAHQRCQAQPPD